MDKRATGSRDEREREREVTSAIGGENQCSHAAKCQDRVTPVMRVDVRLCLLLPHVQGQQGKMHASQLIPVHDVFGRSGDA